MRKAAERDDAMDVMAAPGSQHWADRLPGESVGKFKIFAFYRNMPGRKRSITPLAEQLGCKRGSLYRLSHQWKWGQRIAGYEAWLDRQVYSAIASFTAVFLWSSITRAVCIRIVWNERNT